MKYLILIICCVLKTVSVLSQSTGFSLLNTIWQNVEENYIYIVYKQNKIYEITDYTKSSYPEGDITMTMKIYGFYDSCDLSSLDSLKQSGRYYFELDSTDFENEEFRKIGTYQNCAELTIFPHETDTLMTIYYSSRQQYVTYKRINSLPENVVKYLKEKGIEINNSKR